VSEDPFAPFSAPPSAGRARQKRMVMASVSLQEATASLVDGLNFEEKADRALGLLMGFLGNPKFDIEPILDVIANTIMPLSDNVDSGYHIPCMITGMLDEHPRSAMAFMKNGDDRDYVGFYRQFLDDLSD